MVGVRKLLSLVLLVALVTAGLGAWAPAAQAADTGNPAPQAGRIVSDEPGKNTPNILDGSVFSIAKVGNTIVVGGQFTQANNGSGPHDVDPQQPARVRRHDGQVLPNFAPDPAGKVWKVLPAADGKSVYVAGEFRSAAGKSVPGHVFKVDVTTGVVDPTFVARRSTARSATWRSSGTTCSSRASSARSAASTRRRWARSSPTPASATPTSTTCSRARNTLAGAVTNVLQISVNPQNTELMAVGNFTSVDGQTRWQIARLDIANIPSGTNTTVHSSAVALVDDPLHLSVRRAVRHLHDRRRVLAATAPSSWCPPPAPTAAPRPATPARRGATWSRGSRTTRRPTSTPTWTAYTGSDTTWNVEVTDHVVYAGGHQKYQNNPGGNNTAGPGAVSREGIAALNTINGMPLLVEPDPRPRRRRAGHAGDARRSLRRLGHRADRAHAPATPTTPASPFLPLATGTTLPPLQTTTLPVTLYRVASGGSQLTTRNFTGTTAGTARTRLTDRAGAPPPARSWSTACSTR